MRDSGGTRLHIRFSQQRNNLLCAVPLFHQKNLSARFSGQKILSI
jgi:hypothetical protein